MNRVFGNHEEDGLVHEESTFVMKLSKPIGKLFVGECPIVVESEETARAACQWGYESVKRQLLEKGFDELEAEAVAADYRLKQFKEMIKAAIRIGDAEIKKRSNLN